MIKPSSLAESAELVLAARRAVAARQVLVMSNARLVISIAKRYHKSFKVSIEDLIQEGNIGLIKGIETYDPTRGTTLSTWVSYNIERGIRKSLAELSRTISVPKNVHEKIIKVRNAYLRLEQLIAREPTKHEVAAYLEGEFSPEQIEALRFVDHQDTISLNTPAGEEGDAEIIDLIADETDNGIESYFKTSADKAELSRRLAEANLTDREILVLSLKFQLVIRNWLGTMVETSQGVTALYDKLIAWAINSQGQLTSEKIGLVLGVSRQRVHQNETKAIEKLKK